MTERESDTASPSTNGERLAIFEKVRTGMKLSNLPPLALSLRVRDQMPASIDSNINSPENPLDCSLLPEQLFGSHHILFQLEFSDGILWLLKVPVNGHSDAFDEMSALSLKSEALTMRLLKEETMIPIPEVYHFSDSLDNSLSCSFILMEHISGRSLHDVWFDRSIDPEVLEQRRCKALHDIAKNVGNVSGIEPLRRVDMKVMLDCLEIDDAFDGSPVFRTVGPFADENSFFLSLYGSQTIPEDEFGRGIYELLRLFVEFAFSDNGVQKKKKGEEFVLSHPDLDIQNVIVSENGSLRGLFDCDGVAAVPRCLENERYPSWLTRDWDPMNYQYDAVEDETGHNASDYENSPLELNHYREIYQKNIEALQSLSRKTTTSNSLILENLQIAADDPVCTFQIVEKMCQEIKARSVAANNLSVDSADRNVDADRSCEKNECDDDEKDNDKKRSQNEVNTDEDDDDIEDRLYTGTMAIALAKGEMSETQLQQLKAGFLDMLS